MFNLIDSKMGEASLNKKMFGSAFIDLYAKLKTVK